MTFESAATLPLDRVALLFCQSFAGYFVPIELTAKQLAARLRIEQIDLHFSSVVFVDGEPAGIALLGMRGDRAWCGGFGVVPQWRGKGLALPLTRHMLAVASANGATSCALEVLCQNERAIQVYTSAGFRVARDLLSLEWGRVEPLEVASREDALASFDPRDLLPSFGRLRPAEPPWQRDLPSLLAMGGLRGVVLGDPATPTAYAVLRMDPKGTRIADFGMRDHEAGTSLLELLQRRFDKLSVANEPEPSPTIRAFVASGFVEVHRQHEMTIALAAS